MSSIGFLALYLGSIYSIISSKICVSDNSGGVSDSSTACLSRITSGEGDLIIFTDYYYYNYHWYCYYY